jgi:hypothetical protein
VTYKAWKARKRSRPLDDSSDEDSTPSPKPRSTLKRTIKEREAGVGVGVGLKRRNGQSTKTIEKEQSRPVETQNEACQKTQLSRPSKRSTKIKPESGPPRWKREAKRLSRRTSTAFLGA